MVIAPKQSDKLRVFVSYSRDDLEFADQLIEGLELTGFDATIDRHGIAGGEAWERRLGTLIREADTVVFVLSPASAVSQNCAWEVEEAARLNKRFVPILPRSLGNLKAPQMLVDLNYIFFYSEPKSPGSGFGSGLKLLVAALNTDLDWLREHTRLLQRATEWEAASRPENRLLSGADIAAAKAWAARRPKRAPEPTAIHLDYIRASEEVDQERLNAERKRLDEVAQIQSEREDALSKAEIAQREKAIAARQVVRRTIAGMVVAVCLAISAAAAGLFAWNNQRLAEGQRQRAEKNLAAVTDALTLLDDVSDSRQIAQKFFDLAHNYLNQDRFEEAITLYKRSLAIAEKQFGTDSLQVATARTQLGAVYIKLKKYGEAEPLFKEALQYHEQTSTTGHENAATILALLSELYRVQNLSVQVAEIDQKARAIALANAADVLPIFFGTDRVRGPNPNRIEYGADRAHKLELGRALVTVPKIHQVSTIERPWVIELSKLKVFEEAEDPRKHFTIEELKILKDSEVADAAKQRLMSVKAFQGQSLIFIHGSNTSFDNALYRMADLVYNLKFDGVSFIYSWPSAGGEIQSYTYDRGSAEQSEPHFAEFLQFVVKESGAKSISIIAHSMGNELLLRVLEHLRPSLPDGVVINQIILAAPDVDRDKFARLAGEIANFARGVTLYAASNDRALSYSARFWGNVPRAGDVPSTGPVIVAGVDTIDVTDISTESLGLNHSAYAENKTLVDDLALLLRTGVRPPDKRDPGILPIETDRGTYWRYSAR